MKRREFLTGMGVTVLAAGCAGINLKENGEQGVFTLFMVETATVPIGYYAAQSEEIDTAMRAIYDLAVEGKLTPAAVNKILQLLDTDDPIATLMIGRVLRLAELAGATVEGGSVISMTDIDPRVVKAAADGYVEGYDTYMLTAKPNWKKKTLYSMQA